MADLPLILAGPILRRVEPTLVAVWIALSQPRALTLTVFEGFNQTGPGRDRFLGGQLRMRGGANTLRLGEHLHVGVVFAENPTVQPLNPSTNYSYNLGFGPFRTNVPPGGTFDVPQDLSEADLKTEGLLSDQPLNGRPHLPIGYTVGELPSFALPPTLLTDLRILHGSCRRPGHIYDSGDGKNSFDGMAWVDDLILEWRRGTATTQALDPNVRPHQLFLTGDQIYADDVAYPMVPFLNRAANALIGKTELLPTRYPPEADLASREKFLGVPKQAGFTDLDDFVRKKKAAGLDPLEELKNDPRVRTLQDPGFDRLFKLLFLDPFQQEGGFQSDPAAPGIRFWPADLDHFPAILRRPLMECESKFSSADLASHLMSLGEYCAMYLAVFANTIWEMNGDKPRLPTVDELYSLPATLSQLWDLHACFTWEKACLSRKDRPALEKSLADTAPGKGGDPGQQGLD